MAKKKKIKKMKRLSSAEREKRAKALASPVIVQKKEKVQPFKVKRIRMLMSVANEKVAFTAGTVYKVGVEITPEAAESYIRTGVAEEDMSLGVPEEIKETITHPVGKLTEEPVTTSGEQEIEIEGEKEEEAPKEEEKEETPKKEEKAEEPKEEKVEIEKK